IYNSDKKVLARVIKNVKEQKFDGKFELLLIDKKLGFSTQMNIGMKKSKYEIVVMLPQDCIPADKYWLKKLVYPLKDKRVIASVSKVQLPDEIWDNFSLLTKAIMIKEAGTITPTLDGKGSAYRKKIMKSIDWFDEKNFRTAGEDYDAYIKIKDLGKIAYPNAKVIHYHSTNFKNRLRKNYQYANGYGALVRIHGIRMTRWYVGIIKAMPLIGIIIYGLSYPFSKGRFLFSLYIITSIIDHFYYMFGFWKGFLTGKQTV
ncbi:MAG: glycosyltransferase family 2 protein, partial [Nanoarchaeota archaeon]